MLHEMVLIVFSFMKRVSTTVITVVLLQTCIDLWSGEHGCHCGMCATSSEVGNEVIRVQFEGVTEVTEGEDRQPVTSSLISTDSWVGFMSVVCLACFIGIQNCLSVYQSILVKQQFDPGEWFYEVAMTR